jgi:hypothetical protein
MLADLLPTSLSRLSKTLSFFNLALGLKPSFQALICKELQRVAPFEIPDAGQ